MSVHFLVLYHNFTVSYSSSASFVAELWLGEAANSSHCFDQAGRKEHRLDIHVILNY
jgi:hypothetical protein